MEKVSSVWGTFQLIMSFNFVDYASITDKRIKDKLEAFALRYKKISEGHIL